MEEGRLFTQHTTNDVRMLGIRKGSNDWIWKINSTQLRYVGTTALKPYLVPTQIMNTLNGHRKLDWNWRNIISVIGINVVSRQNRRTKTKLFCFSWFTLFHFHHSLISMGLGSFQHYFHVPLDFFFFLFLLIAIALSQEFLGGFNDKLSSIGLHIKKMLYRLDTKFEHTSILSHVIEVDNAEFNW